MCVWWGMKGVIAYSASMRYWTFPKHQLSYNLSSGAQRQEDARDSTASQSS